MMMHYPTAINEDGKLKIPVLKKAVIDFFGELSANATVLSEAKDEDVFELPLPLSPSTVKGYRSALVDLHRINGKELEKKLDMELMNVLHGYEKVICELKQRGRIAINEGKRHLKWSGYVVLARKFLTRAPAEGVHGQSCSSIVFGWSNYVELDESIRIC
jgi:hypothetical protein